MKETLCIIKTDKGYLKQGIVGSHPEFTQEWNMAKFMSNADVVPTAKYHAINDYSIKHVVVTYEFKNW